MKSRISGADFFQIPTDDVLSPNLPRCMTQERSNLKYVKVAECLYRATATGTYYALVKKRGKQIRKSLGTTDRKLAERRLTEFREKVGRLTETGSGKILFAELADRWLAMVRGNMKSSSAKRREVCIGQLKPFFGQMPVRNISSRDCDSWIIKRGNRLSSRTYNIERETLTQILAYAKRDGFLLDNPAESIPRRKETKKQIIVPTREQFQVLVQTIRSADCRAHSAANLVELLAYSGMRLSEAINLLWGDVDFVRHVFTVTGGQMGTKNGNARTIPLFPAMGELLERIKGESNPSPKERIIPIRTAKKAIATACKKAELPHFHHHTQRHYFASNAIEVGIDFKVISHWLGHRDGGSLVAKTYGHLRDAHSFDMAKRMIFSAHAPESNVVKFPDQAAAV